MNVFVNFIYIFMLKKRKLKLKKIPFLLIFSIFINLNKVILLYSFKKWGVTYLPPPPKKNHLWIFHFNFILRSGLPYFEAQGHTKGQTCAPKFTHRYFILTKGTGNRSRKTSYLVTHPPFVIFRKQITLFSKSSN